MVVLEEIRVYINHHNNTVAKYIATHPIMDLCLEAEKKPGMHLSRRWWEHPALDILGIRARCAAPEGGGRRRRERESRVGEDDGERMI